MGLFDKLFKGDSKKLSSTELPQNNTTLPQTNYYHLQRADGSTISIAPETDPMGYQLYSQIYNSRTNQLQNIPRFWVISDELKALSIHQNLVHESLLIDIDPNILQNPYYANEVANQLLSADRMKKIMGAYHKYVGGLQYDQQGYVTGKYVDQGIITSLSMDAKQREADRQASVAQDLAAKEKSRNNIPPHFEQYAEQQLSSDMLDGYR